MNCLLVSATPFEIAPFLEKHSKSPGQHLQLDVLVSGIGLTATAYAVTRQLQLKKYDWVVQAGVGGCFDRQIPLGAVVGIKRDTIADQGVMENKKLKTVFDMKLAPENKFPYTRGWLINPHKDMLKKIQRKSFNAISVNEITTGRVRIGLLAEKYGAVVESMEGAAFHLACLMEGVPFVQLRALSNYVGERDKAKWKMKDSIQHLGFALEDLLLEE